MGETTASTLQLLNVIFNVTAKKYQEIITAHADQKVAPYPRVPAEGRKIPRVISMVQPPRVETLPPVEAATQSNIFEE